MKKFIIVAVGLFLFMGGCSGGCLISHGITENTNSINNAGSTSEYQESNDNSIEENISANDSVKDSSDSNEHVDVPEPISEPVKNGWLKENNKWYFYENNNKKTGWLQFDSNWYYLNSDGSMAENTSIDGYYIHHNGIAEKIPEKKNDTAINIAPASNNNSVKTAVSDNSKNNSQTVYWVPKGKCYHTNKNCPTLSRSKDIRQGALDDCPNKTPCKKCS